MTSSRIHVVLAYAGCCLIWGSTWMMIKIGLRGAPPLTSLALRMTVATVIVAAVVAVARIRIPRDARFRGLGLFVGVFQVILPYTFVYYGEQRIPSGLAAVLYATFPLLVALLARLWLHAPLSARGIAGVVIGMAGVTVIFSDNLHPGQHHAAGAALVMASVVASAIGSVGTKKWGHGHHPIASLLIPFATSAVVLWALAVLVESPVSLVFNRTTWATILYLAAVGSVGAFACFFYVMLHLDVRVVSYQTFIIPVIAVLLGAVFLGEAISTRVAAGGTLILVGIALATVSRRRSAT